MKFIPISLTQKIGRQILTVKKDAPRTLFALGILGTVGSTVLACRATLKLHETLDDMRKDVDETNAMSATSTTTMHRKNLAYSYAKGTGNILRLYAPAIILGGASIGALTSSHVTLTRRNASLTAAYSAVAASLEAYRERVREELGVEKELEIHHGAKLMMAPDDKKSPMYMADPNKWSPYARFFDEANPNWEKNPEYNRLFIQCQQNYLNHLLHARGHVFLNEAYDQLGLERSSAGQCVGWVLNQGGDNFIDFGLFEAASTRFINNYERNIILDFNVDGLILDKL